MKRQKAKVAVSILIDRLIKDMVEDINEAIPALEPFWTNRSKKLSELSLINLVYFYFYIVCKQITKQTANRAPFSSYIFLL